MRDKSADDKDFLAFLASFIAQDQDVPLLADERACQAMTLNERQGATHAAFGSDAVVPALSKSGMLDVSGAAEAMLTLMRWRYRFVVPSEPVNNFEDVCSAVPREPAWPAPPRGGRVPSRLQWRGSHRAARPNSTRDGKDSQMDPLCFTYQKETSRNEWSSNSPCSSSPTTEICGRQLWNASRRCF